MRLAFAFMLGSGLGGFAHPFVGTVAAVCIGIIATGCFELHLIGREADQ
jgi:hypothetical protein